MNTRHFLDSHGTPQIKEVQLLRADIQNLWPETEPSSVVPAPAEELLPGVGIAIPQGKRGPKLKYDGDAYIAEVIRFLDYNGGISPVGDPNFTRQTVLDHMEVWCQRWWKIVPGDTWHKDHIRIAIARYEQGKGAN